MDVIDEKGRLFGVVNVVDALVVLVVLAMLVAGTALVLGGDDTTEPTEPAPERFATVAYDVPVGSDAATLSANDTLASTGGGESYAVADVYRSFTPNGSAFVVATVRYRGRMTAGGSTVYGGDAVSLTTGSYRVRADVLSVNGTGATIPTTNRSVVLEANVTPAVADAIESGATATIGGETVATVTAVERSDAPGGKRRVLVGAKLVVWDRKPVPAFDGRPLRVGNRVTILTDTVRIPGRVAAVGTDDPATVTNG